VCRQSGHLSCCTQGNVDVRNVYHIRPSQWHLVMCAITGKSVRLFVVVFGLDVVVCMLVDPVALCLQVPFSILYFLPIFLLSSIPCRVDNTPAGIFSFLLPLCLLVI
jgi:hypothetical protein